MNELSTPLVALAVLGLVAFLVFAVVRRFRQRAQERQAALRSLGFEPVPAPDREVVDTIVALCRRGKEGRYRVNNLLERRGSGQRVLLFDLHDSSGEHHRPGLLAVTSPRLVLPRFTLFPRLEMEGRLAALANTLLEKFVGHEGRTVGFPDHPSFDRRYFVRGPEEEELRGFLDADRLTALAEKQYLMIEAGGDAFIVDRLNLRGQHRGFDLSDVAERVEEAEAFLRLFSSRG